MACATPTCLYMVHSWPELGGFCCKACAEGEGDHGGRCERVPACWGAMKAAWGDRPMCGRGLQKLDFERSGAAAETPDLFHGAAGRIAPAGQEPGRLAGPDAASEAVADDSSANRLPAKPGRIWEALSAIVLEDGGRVEAGALLIELTRDSGYMRFTLLAGEGPSEGWVCLPPLRDRGALVAAGAEGSTAAKEAAEVERARQRNDSDAPMIWFLSQGTRGDLQPIIAIGVALRRAGFRVRVFVAANLRSMVESHGLLFTEMGRDLKEYYVQYINSSVYKECLPSTCVESFLQFNEDSPLLSEEWMRECTRVVHSALKSETPSMVFPCGLMHVGLTPFLAWRRNKAVVCRLSFCPDDARHTEDWFEHLQGAAKMILEETKINPMGGYSVEGYNRWLVDHQAVVCIENTVDVFLHHLPEADKDMVKKACVGFCVLDQTQQMVNLDEFGGGETLSRVQAYLDAGEKPVYLGWGSMPVHVGFLLKFVAAFKANSTRAIICAGWGKMTLEALKDYAARLQDDHADLVRYAEERLLFIGAAPHEWLFPRCACTIHHGGAGTTCAAVRAGVPTIITPFLVDQPAWGIWVTLCGVGMSLSLQENGDLVEDPAWIEAVKQATTDKEMLARAKKWSRKLRHDDGPSRMVTFVRRTMELSQGENASSVDENGIPRYGW